MREKRKGLRYTVNFRVFFPEFDIYGYTYDISLDGCFVKMDSPMSVGFITDLLLDLPVVGVIALKGYVQHTGKMESGVGLQFVQVKFESDQSDYFSLYSRFLNVMPHLEEIRKSYLDLVQQNRLGLFTLPSGPEKAETT
jgi:hypothetical protein